MTVRVRFAPSPTGRLHVGNARVALANRLLADTMGGRFVLRIDDTDQERSTAAHEAAIETDLAWLGISWEERHRQSERFDLYRAALERLAAKGLAYPAYETETELGLKRAAQLQAGRPPVYDRAALRLSADERAQLEAEGRRPHWRFRLPDRAIAWEDEVHGRIQIDTRDVSDPVLIRADGRWLYTLSSVLDDAEMGISHIVRGDDHITNTAAQIAIFAALDAPIPAFGHLPLLADRDGAKLSKRIGSLSLEGLRGQGIEPMAVASLLMKLGTPDPILPFADLPALAAGFRLDAFGRAMPRFDDEELARLNARLVAQLPYEAVQGRLPAEATPSFWEAVRANCATVAEAAIWWRLVAEPFQPPPVAAADADLVAAAAAALPPAPFDPGTWDAWTKDLAARTGRKGKALFQPLRLALTGRAHGPPLAPLLPFMARARVAARLAGQKG